MTTSLFYPFQTAGEQLSLTARPVEMEVPVGSDGAFLVYQTDITSLRLACSVSVPDTVLDTVYSPTERSDAPRQVLLVCRSIESRRREAQIIICNNGTYDIEIDLSLENWVGTVEIKAFLVRPTEAAQRVAGFASNSASLLAWSTPLRIVMDQPQLPPGQFLDVRWENFTRGGEWLRRHSNHLFALDTSQAPPVLLLNDSITGLRSVLESRGNHGAKARIRDATNSMIVHQVWSSIIDSAIRHLSNTITQEETANLEELELWEQNILKAWAVFLYPDDNFEDAVENITECACTQNSHLRDDLMLRRLPNAIQERFETYKGFGGLVQELTRA